MVLILHRIMGLERFETLHAPQCPWLLRGTDGAVLLFCACVCSLNGVQERIKGKEGALCARFSAGLFFCTVSFM